jgi:phenylacetate-CoA ligase
MGDVNQIEPIEKASIDELRALQLARLKSALHTCYERVPHIAEFDAAGVHPS